MKMGSPRQLKDWINNMAKKNNIIANTVLQNFMMERILERISVSKTLRISMMSVNMMISEFL